MKTKEFEKLVNDILERSGFDVKIELLLLQNQEAKKWYDQHYITCKDIYENTIYGVMYDDIIQFDFKVGKIDNLLKSFIKRFSARYKTYDEKLDLIPKSKLEEIIIEKNQNRVQKGLLYTTLYGIGFWTIFSRGNTNVCSDLKKYLNDNGIEFRNEFSDAFWSYRFIINKSVDLHNELLDNFNSKNI